MGVEALVVSTILGAAGSVYSSQQQKAAVKYQAAEQTRQVQAQSREEEIKRLKLMRDAVGQNLTRAAAGGLSYTGTVGSIVQGNITSAREDVDMIQTMGRAQTDAIKSGAAAQVGALNAQAASGVINAVSSGIVGYSGMTDKLTPSADSLTTTNVGV